MPSSNFNETQYGYKIYRVISSPKHTVEYNLGDQYNRYIHWLILEKITFVSAHNLLQQLEIINAMILKNGVDSRIDKTINSDNIRIDNYLKTVYSDFDNKINPPNRIAQWFAVVIGVASLITASILLLPTLGSLYIYLSGVIGAAVIGGGIGYGIGYAISKLVKPIAAFFSRARGTADRSLIQNNRPTWDEVMKNSIRNTEENKKENTEEQKSAVIATTQAMFLTQYNLWPENLKENIPEKPVAYSNYVVNLPVLNKLLNHL